ncbi:MAG: ATP-binding cassette domain-containing protein [Chloroflexota bacterium]|nr:ATP-binding cassette domain-containing protein [Chloroflexota bacterium]
MTVIVNVAGVSKTYGGIHHVLENCSLEIQKGRKIGMVGPNGAGKSTLFRLIAGREEPDSGAIWRHPGLTIGYLSQEPTFDRERTLIDIAMEASHEIRQLSQELQHLEQKLAEPEVYGDAERLERTMNRYEQVLMQFGQAGGLAYRNRVEGMLHAFGFEDEQFEQPVGVLSGGQKKLLGLAQLLVAQPDLLLLDEPDNHLDIRGKRELERLINDYPGSVVIISHDRYLLDVVAEQIVEVDQSQATLWHGNYSQYAFEKNVAVQSQLKAYGVQQREIKRMENSIRRLISWSKGGQLDKTYKRAMAMQKRLDRIERVDKPKTETRTMALTLNGSRGSDKALEIKGLWKIFEGPDGEEKEVLTDADLLVWSREVVGLVGPNGAGKSVLFKLILGEMEPTAGEIRVGPSTNMVYYSQEHQTLNYDSTVVQEMRKLKPMYEGEAYNFLGRFLFSREQAQKPVRALSGGEKSRLQFAKLMLTPANFLLLDEPTNNLDIPSVEALEQVIENYEGTVFIISHDRYFLDSVATRIVELEDGQLESFPGNWEYYVEEKRQRGEEV